MVHPHEQCSLPPTLTSLERLWAVVSQSHSSHHVDRQLILLESYLSATGDRVNLADLQLLSRILMFVADHAEVDTRYREGFKRILDLLKRPLKMAKTSDQLNYFHYAVDFFSAIGCFLLKTYREEVRTDIIDIVQNWFPSKRTEQSDQFPTQCCVQVVEVSQFVECLAEFMVIVDESMYQRTAFTALQICSLSNFSCWTLLTKGAIETLLVRLTTVDADERPDVVTITCQLMWKLFNCTDHKEDWLKITPPTELALRSLRYLLREEGLTYSHPGHNSSGFQNIAALVLKMLHLFPNAQYVSSGLFEDITFLSTMTEAQIEIRILPYFKSHNEHLRLKQLMLACLAVHPISCASVKVLEDYKVAQCLVSMLIGCQPCSNESWPPELVLDLFKSALPVISVLYDHLLQSFVGAKLMEKLTTFFNHHYILKHDLSDSLAHRAIKVVLSLCQSQVNPSVTHEALRQSGIVPILLKACQMLLCPVSPLTVTRQSMIAHCLCVLTKLMENNDELQKEFSDQSLQIATSMYKRILNPIERDSLLDNKLVMSASYFAWKVVTGNEKSALQFISSGGIFNVIDILATRPLGVQLVYLSMLVDLAEYHQSVPYLISWRGNEGVKLLGVLCKIWRSEENRLGVPRSKEGCITDIERPLMGDEQARLSAENKVNAVTIGDVFASTRPKIYAIVQLLRRHNKVVALCEEHCRLGHDQLSCDDQVTMQLAEAYLPLKMAEVWWEVRCRQGDRVMPMDRYLANTLADRYLSWALCVQRAQFAILERRTASECEEERAFYAQMRAARLPDALQALREVIGVARSVESQLGWAAARRAYREASRAPRDSTGDRDSSELRPAFPPGNRLLAIHSRTDVVIADNPDGHSFTLA